MWMRLSALIAFLVLTVTLPLQGALNAQEHDGDPLRQPPRPELVLEDGRGAVIDREVQRQGPTKVVIELSDAPATQVYATSVSAAAQATALAQQQIQRIDQAQQYVLREMQRQGIRAEVLYRTQRVYNGIAARIDGQDLEAIARISGVKAIHPLITKHRDNSTSVPFIEADHLWNDDLGGGELNDGRGIRIGIIDTGIDYLHTDFGGTGTGYQSNDPTVVEPGSFPTAKVVGGYDFVGDDYDANDPDKATPQPDPDPMDCNGHGTHVAGTAAGFGVNGDGSTYTGPYNSSIDYSAFRIGPGVAPRALLYALKVFGCDGATDVTDAALEWAVDPNGDGDFSDHLDVVNMSLGSPFGGPYDSSAIASNNAALIGVIVVASAGNSGDTFYITGSPASASHVISVASSLDNGLTFLAIQVNSPASLAGQRYEAGSADFGPALTASGITGDVVYPASNRLGCQPFPAGTFDGKIALIDRGTCNFSLKVYHAQQAGAIAAIIVNNVPGSPIQMAPGDRASEVRIPSVMIGQSDGRNIKDALAAGDTVNVTLSSTIRIARPDLADTLSSFSSRGPRRAGSVLKPDIAAPGQTITSARAGSGNQSLTISGTSMAAPHVAGAMALLRQLHPDWSVEELKALVMNTATHNVRIAAPSDAPIYNPSRVGAGRIDVRNARNSQVIAYDAEHPELVSVSFGAPQVITTATVTRTIRLENKGNSPVTYNVAYQPVTQVPGVTITMAQETVTVPAGGMAAVRLTMRATAADMQHVRSPDVAATQTLARHWLSEASGYLTLTPSSGQALRVPVYAAPRPASDMRAETSTLDLSSTDTVSATIRLTGRGIGSSAALTTPSPEDLVSVVSAFELQYVSRDIPTRPNVGHADLAYVGVASDYHAAGSIADTTIAFGIATHQPWETPSIPTFTVYIDTDDDGTDDYALYNTSYGRATGSDPTDVFVTVLEDLETETASLQFFLNGLSPSTLSTAVYNSRVMMLPVAAADLGLTSADDTFTYRVVSRSRDNELRNLPATAEDESIVDQTPRLTYTPGRPGLDLTGGAAGLPLFLDLPGNTIPVRFFASSFNASNSLGVLLLHHLNTVESQAEIVVARGGFQNQPYVLYMPSVFNQRSSNP